jgi:adenine-specific DNA methylase
MSDAPRLIEVAFPLKQASLASVHEKNVRHGHISTLHIWPARRPLAASRAALLATLLPDPGDPEKRKALLDRIGGAVTVKTVKETDDDGNAYEEEKETVTGGVLAWGTENSPDLGALRKLIRKANGGTAPRVIDPFSGGGAIPLEAMRLGCEVTAADINPVAWFILKCTLEYPQQFAGKKWPLPDFVKQWPDFVTDFRAGKVKKRKGGARSHFTDEHQRALDGNAINPEAPPTSPGATADFGLSFEADLAWHVRAWGRWVLERARQDLAARYPVIGGEPTVAYLWARTARDKQTAGPIPLLKTFWLCKKAGRRAALLPLPVEPQRGGTMSAQGNALGIGPIGESRAESPAQPFVRFALLQEADLKNPAKIIETHPILAQWEVTPETLTDFLNKGTMNRAGVWSPLTGRPGMIALTMADLRRQGQQGLLGSQMTAVVVEQTTITKTTNSKGREKETRKTRKAYRLPVEAELQAATVEIEDLEDAFKDIPFGIPDEPLPQGGGSGAGRAFSIPKYGFKKWREIFTPRQLLSLACFVRQVRELESSLRTKGNSEAAQAISAYLAAAIDRLADYSSAICSWHNTGEKMRNTFGRFALPMIWDYCEVNPLSDTSGNFNGAIEWITLYIEHALLAGQGSPPPQILNLSATKSAPIDVDVVLTDPPYYDAIPYSDLMDFFFIWLKRVLTDANGIPTAAFSASASPKWNHDEQDGELVEDESRFGGDKAAAKNAYQDGMARAFQRGFEKLTSGGRLVIVFANKEVDAWETLVEALIRAGAIVTASWPIQTEMQNRPRGQASAALSSSVWIVCRKRAKTAQAGWEENVLEAMRRTLFEARETLGGRNILQYYFDLGIRGPDFLWAALGPALEAYSAHPFVKKTAGGMLTVPEFLKEVRRLVLHFALGELPGFRDISQQTQGRGESLELDPVTQYYLLHRAYFGLDPAPAGACIMYANGCGMTDNELKLVWHIIDQGGKSKRGRPSNDELQDPDDDSGESKGNEFKLVPWEERAAREDFGESRNNRPAPLIDRLHRMMRLFQQNRASEVQQAYDAWGLANDRAFPPLLQAVRELALHDRQDTERRLVEALATQLKLNRRQVSEISDGQQLVVQSPLFGEDSALDLDSIKPVSYRSAGKKRRSK